MAGGAPPDDHPNAVRVAAALAAAGIEPTIAYHEQTARTADEAAAAVGVDVGQIVKSLIFLVDDEPVLALVSGPNRLDTGKLGALAGGRVHRADADRARAAAGYPIGGVPPLGHPAPLRTWIDGDLLQHAVVWSAAGTPHHVFPAAPSALVAATGGVVADIVVR